MKPDNIEERIRDAMTGEQAAPRTEAWEGIAARRVAGDRVVLPLDQRRWMRIATIAAVAAATLALVIPMQQDEPTTVTPRAAGKSPAGDGFFTPGALMAQASAMPAFSTSVSSRNLAHAGRWIHARYEDGEMKERYEYSMRPSTLNGAPSWLVLAKSNRQYSEWLTADSTWFSPDSLQPQLRITWVGETRFEQTYRPNDILTGVTRNGYTSWSTTPQADPSRMFGGGSLFRPAEIGVRIQAMDLSAIWRGSIPLPAYSEQPIPSLWINLIVDGKDTVTVPAGTFECWRIRSVITTRPIEKYDPAKRPSGLYFWVSTDRQWLIKMEYVTSGLPNEIGLTPLVLIDGKEE